eukprot:scaffold45615_cov63-Phaeocystis_antarctica.AAC.2
MAQINIEAACGTAARLPQPTQLRTQLRAASRTGARPTAGGTLHSRQGGSLGRLTWTISTCS